ncbi:MAG: hypothetical protein HYX27_07125 [Acidobacteria bacterium]|nr:hypothetical protein [Acidobacteriota bacterium]
MSSVLTSREEGELLLVRLRVESRHLEEVLEALADLPFPVNPDLQHVGLHSVVEFPAYEHRLAAVQEALKPFELSVETRRMMDAIRAQ